MGYVSIPEGDGSTRRRRVDAIWMHPFTSSPRHILTPHRRQREYGHTVWSIFYGSLSVCRFVGLSGCRVVGLSGCRVVGTVYVVILSDRHPVYDETEE